MARLPIVPLEICSLYGTSLPVPSGNGADAGRGGRLDAGLVLFMLPSQPPRPPKPLRESSRKLLLLSWLLVPSASC